MLSWDSEGNFLKRLSAELEAGLQKPSRHGLVPRDWQRWKAITAPRPEGTRTANGLVGATAKPQGLSGRSCSCQGTESMPEPSAEAGHK